jgi:hypothetical protein
MYGINFDRSRCIPAKGSNLHTFWLLSLQVGWYQESKSKTELGSTLAQGKSKLGNHVPQEKLGLMDG